MKKRVLISSIYSANTIKILMLKFSITDLFLVVEKDLDKLKGKTPQEEEELETKRDSIKKIKEDFNKIVNIKIIEVETLYNFYDIAKKITKKVDSLENCEIFFNISEGRKPLSFGMYFAGYLRKSKVEGIYYLMKENNEPLRMPFPHFHINKFQKEILRYLEKGERAIKDLRKKFDKEKAEKVEKQKERRTRSVLYKAINDLEKDGYILIEEQNVKITDLGRILLL